MPNSKPWLGRKRDAVTKDKISRTIRERGLSWSDKARMTARKVILERYGSSPMNNPQIASKVSQSLKRRFADKTRHPCFGRILSPETRKKISERQKAHREEAAVRMRALRERPDVLAKIVKACHSRPNRAEAEFQRVNLSRNLGFEFVGNGSFLVGTKNPDFVNVESKQIVEIFGRAFHDPETSFRQNIPYHQTEQGAVEYYARRGWNCLVLWEEDLKEPSLSEKLKCL